MKTFPESKFITTFSITDKVYMRTAIFGYLVVAMIAVYAENAVYGIIYTALALIHLLVMLYTLCSHCPHVYVYHDCVFAPAGIIRNIFQYRRQPMDRRDKSALMVMIGISILFPQFFLVKRPLLFGLFWLFVILMGLRFYAHLCKVCRNVSCPCNRVCVTKNTEMTDRSHQ